MESTFKYRLWYVWMVCRGGGLGRAAVRLRLGGHRRRRAVLREVLRPHVGLAARLGHELRLVGCLFGALGSGALSDRFGRKRLLTVAAILFAVSSIGTGMANHFHVFIAWRICGGVAIGLASNLSPMYIAEIAPAQMRGKLVAVNQFTIVIGILLAQCINCVIAHLPCAWNRADMALAVDVLRSRRFLRCYFSREVFLFPRARAGSPRAAVTTKPAPSWRGGRRRLRGSTPLRRSGPPWAARAPGRFPRPVGSAGAADPVARDRVWRCFNNGAASTSSSIMRPYFSRRPAIRRGHPVEHRHYRRRERRVHHRGHGHRGPRRTPHPHARRRGRTGRHPLPAGRELLRA